MINVSTAASRPLQHCVPCSQRTPHRYERVAIEGKLTSRAICLLCNNDSRAGGSIAAEVPLNGIGPDRQHSA
jgi:hypothetical protein